MSVRNSGKRRGRVRAGTLIVLSSLLIGSAVLRTATQAGPAIAREIAHGAGNAATPSHQDPATQAPNAPGPDEFRAMLAAFQQREIRLQKREAELQDRMKAVDLAEAAIDQRLEELVTAEERLRRTVAIADGASEGDLTRLTEVYEKMNPKESAKLFEEMDPEFAAGFLARMKPQVAASILAGLTPQTAYTISVVLAGRNAKAPTE